MLTSPTAAATLGPVDVLESGGNSSYNGLLLTIQKRLSRGISFNANYTWSHCIGDVPIGSGVGGPESAGGAGGSYTDVNNRRRDRGNCNAPTIEGNQTLDRRHILNFTTVLETPRFRDRSLNHVLSNWKLALSYRFLSASYLSITDGVNTDVALNGSGPAGGQRANQLMEDVFCKQRNYACWINQAAFATPATGTLGNAGRSNIAGPGFFGMDMGMSRVFRVREFVSLEARGEAFNLTNGVPPKCPHHST